MTLDLSFLQHALQIVRQPSPGRPGSVRPTALQMHEILGGQVGNTTPIIRGGYFAAWAAGGTRPQSAPTSTTTGEPNQPVLTPPSITVTSLFDQPVANFPVRFRITKGGGLLENDQTVVEKFTDAAGVAGVTSWTLGPVTGLNEVVAEGFNVDRAFRVTAV